MIPSRGATDSITSSDWDLTSSATGTVKRRPESSSPSTCDDIDFPADVCRAAGEESEIGIVNDNAKQDAGSCNINKLRRKSSREGSESVDDEAVRRRKINSKRFFDSAKKSFASKLKLPNLSPRKLSLSQLERQNNLFIRDGQSSSSGEEAKLSKHEEMMATRGKAVVMEKPESANPKQKQESLGKSKKSSLIPSFLNNHPGAGAKSAANHIKIPSTSTSSSARKASSSATVVEKLTKTSNKFKELYRDFPSSGGSEKASSAKRHPPPYRPPPAPPQNKQKQIRFDESETRNYEEIEPISEETIDDEDGEMHSKAEYSSNVFKNIPVRARKGVVPHMDNYCLFDPSVDFANEKELMKKKLLMQAAIVQESIEDVTFEDQTVYDVSEHDEREKSLAHHNYYEIDPDLLLEEIQEEEETIVEPVPVERKKEKAKVHRKSKVYCNTLSTSSESTSTSQTSTNSSSTTTSSDYPSLFNSVIETTHSSNVESTTDDNDSNGYGKSKAAAGDTINQANAPAVANESVITSSTSAVTCGESNASTGAKKKSPQLNRIIRPSSSSSSTQTKQTSTLTAKSKPSKSNLPTLNKSQLDAMKSSHSLPHLQSRTRQQGDLNFVIDNSTTIQLRRQHSSRQGRPLSGHSDDRDSGFLSPVTPPDSHNPPAHITPNVIIKGAEPPAKAESTLLNQCDNIQQLIEVSNARRLAYVSCDKWTFCR